MTRPPRGTSYPLVFTRNLSGNSFFPDKFGTVVVTTLHGYWAAGAMTAAAGNYFTLLANGIFSPFGAGTYFFTTGTGTATFASNGTLIQGESINVSPMGYTSLFSSLYNYYRVYKYKIEISIVPQSAADGIRLVVVPLGAEEIPSPAAGSVNLRVLEQQPCARAKNCFSGVTVGSSAVGGSNTIIIEGYCNNDLGLTYAQYKDLPMTGIGNNPTTSIQDWIGFYAQQLNGSNNASPVTCEIKLSQYVEFSDINQPLN